jgi:hypothetical protein
MREHSLERRLLKPACEHGERQEEHGADGSEQSREEDPRIGQSL